MNIQAKFDQFTRADSYREAAIRRYSSCKLVFHSEITLIFSVRFTLLAEALQRNVNGVDKMDFQCHSTFLKSFVGDFVTL